MSYALCVCLVYLNNIHSGKVCHTAYISEFGIRIGIGIRMKREGHTRSELLKWNMDHLHQSSCLLQEGGVHPQ